MSGLHRPVVRYDATGRAGLGLTHLAACLFHSHIPTTRRADTLVTTNTMPSFFTSFRASCIEVTYVLSPRQAPVDHNNEVACEGSRQGVFTALERLAACVRWKS